MRNIIQIQEEYMETVNGGMDRWSHHRDGGHAGRIRSAAHKKALSAFLKIGFDPQVAEKMVRDAHDLLLLERAGVDDDLNHAS